MSNLFSRVSASDRPSVPHLRSMVIAAVAVLVIFGGLYVWRAPKSAAAPREAPPAVAVIATIVQPTDVPATLEAVGSVRAVREVTLAPERSEERGVGKECVSTGRSRWPPYHSTKKTKHLYRTED